MKPSFRHHTQRKMFVLFFLLVLCLLQSPLNAQLARNQKRFLGNVGQPGVRSDFDTYWNQITPENDGKWGSVEGTRNVMNWAGLDLAYNYAKSKGILFKEHTLVWGSQEPTWIATLSPAEQKAEVEEWIRLFFERYPNTDLVDVVNEPLAGHAPASYREAIGGSGTTGWDWIVWSFEKARQYSKPGTKLLINEYNILNSTANTDAYIQIVNILKARNLIDGVGVQAHYFELQGQSISFLKQNLDKLAATGVPVYITELEIDEPFDNNQLSAYQNLFPLFWEHPAVSGITLWGYIAGKMWKADGYLVGKTIPVTGVATNDTTKRPALLWLRDAYPKLNNHKPMVAANQNLPVDGGTCNVVGNILATDEDNDALQDWKITGGTGALFLLLMRLPAK